MSESAEACAECKAPIAAAPPPSPRVAKGEAIAGGRDLCTSCRRMKKWAEARGSLPRGLDTDSELLLATLELAVPLRIEFLSHRAADYVLGKERCQRLADVIAYEGDVIQFQSKKKGKTAAAFAELVDALATLAFMPGGIEFCGRTWQATHQGRAPKGLAKA